MKTWLFALFCFSGVVVSENDRDSSKGFEDEFSKCFTAHNVAEDSKTRTEVLLCWLIPGKKAGKKKRCEKIGHSAELENCLAQANRGTIEQKNTQHEISSVEAMQEDESEEEFRRGRKGDETRTRCDEMRGFCECLDVNGNSLPGYGPRTSCQKLTKCQRQWYEGRKDGKSRRKCDDDGRYLLKHCDDFNDDNSCYCVDQETGEKLGETNNYYKLDCKAKCEGGTVYQACGGCEVTCHNRGRPVACDQMCRSLCACPHGLLWSGVKRECVPEEQC